MIQSTHNGSWDVAAQCFLNSLIRETKDWRLSQGEPAELVIPLAEEKALHFKVAYFSPTQHHRFAFPARLVTHRGSETVTFATVARLIVDKLQHQQQLPAPGCEAFYQRVMESHAHTAEATAARHDWRSLREKALNFAEAEQALLVGHAFHPAPKSHEPFTQQQAERYLPDFAPHFPLRWFAVDKDQLAGDSLQLTLQQRLTRFAAENAPQLLHALTDRQWLFPLHPWQADYLLQQTWCQQLVEKGLVTDLGEAGAPWLPTTSSRSLYCATSRDMIKFSLSVRLTNSVRTLSVKEVKRGMRLARLAQTDRWQDMQARFPAFRVMQEDGWAGLRDAQGTIMEESLFALRENLIVDRPQSQTNPDAVRAGRRRLTAVCRSKAPEPAPAHQRKTGCACLGRRLLSAGAEAPVYRRSRLRPGAVSPSAKYPGGNGAGPAGWPDLSRLPGQRLYASRRRLAGHDWRSAGGKRL